MYARMRPTVLSDSVTHPGRLDTVFVVVVVVVVVVVEDVVVVVVEVARAHVCGHTIATAGSVQALQTAELHPTPYCALRISD